MRLAGLATWALAAMMLSGCRANREPPRVIVSGKVTYRGEPVADGVIRFIPLPRCPVPSSGAYIVAGCYRADGRGGVPVGTHRVEIEAYRAVPINVQPGAPLPPGMPEEGHEQYLPDRYNTSTQLEITIEPSRKGITKDFDLAE